MLGNKINVTLLCMLLVTGLFQPVFGSERRIRQEYPLKKLSANVYVIHGPADEVSKQNQGFRNNPILVVTQQGVVIIDPGSSVYTGEMLVGKARQLGKKPVVAVFNTHGHGDHWLGNHGVQKHYPDVAIYAHPGMAQAIAAGDGEMWIKAINQRTEGAIEGTRVVAPNRAVKPGDEIRFGNITFRIHANGKGHSENDIMIELVEEGVFVFGDNLRIGNISPFMASFSGNLAALELGDKTSAKVFVPGHGLSGNRSVIADYRKFIVTLKAEVKKYFDAGMSDFEMKPKVIKALQKYQAWTGFDENIGRLISLAYLEVENESF